MNKLLEPTEVMIAFGAKAGFLYAPEYPHFGSEGKATAIYNAMISKSEAIPKLLAVVEAAKIHVKFKDPASLSTLIRKLEALEEK